MILFCCSITLQELTTQKHSEMWQSQKREKSHSHYEASFHYIYFLVLLNFIASAYKYGLYIYIADVVSCSVKFLKNGEKLSADITLQ